MKKLTIGIIIGLMLGISTNAFAAIGDTVTAVFAQFEYKVNGQTETVESPVLVYEGTSYLRTTDIANMLGYDVTYKANSRTIEFDNPEPVVEPIPVVEVAPTIPAQVEPTSYTPPTGTPEPIAEPVIYPVVEPTLEVVAVPDNTAVCKQIRDKYAMEIWNAEQRGKWTEAHYSKYYRDQELANAGC